MTKDEKKVYKKAMLSWDDYEEEEDDGVAAPAAPAVSGVRAMT